MEWRKTVQGKRRWLVKCRSRKDHRRKPNCISKTGRFEIHSRVPGSSPNVSPSSQERTCFAVRNRGRLPAAQAVPWSEQERKREPLRRRLQEGLECPFDRPLTRQGRN